MIGTGVAVLVSLSWLAFAEPAQGQSAGAPPARTGQQIYETICVTCHGPDGRSQTEMAKAIPLPDFTDCAFANREPDGDWLAVAHYGGPARGFSPLMPPWLGTLSSQELQLAVSHVRTFCTDQRWPRGELNLPRPLVTEKAFPEDESVFTFRAATDSPGSTQTAAIYERRFGPVNQIEIVVPFATNERAPGEGSDVGLGDIAVAVKRTLAHSLASGRIVSVAGEVVIPTGSERKGLGSGTVVFEPFVAFGQLFPRDAFLQAQGGVEIPASGDHDVEAFWRVAVGKSLTQPRFGRTWTPMVELLAARAVADEASVAWDVVPQMQVTLSTRQHIMLSAGVRVPVNARDARSTTVLAYLLWDWYDGGFFSGW